MPRLRIDPGGSPAATGTGTVFFSSGVTAGGGGSNQAKEDVPSQVTTGSSSGNR